MMKYSKEFIAALEDVDQLNKDLVNARKLVQRLCPHVHLDSSSAFPRGPSFVECTLCGMSSYYLGREGDL